MIAAGQNKVPARVIRDASASLFANAHPAGTEESMNYPWVDWGPALAGCPLFRLGPEGGQSISEQKRVSVRGLFTVTTWDERIVWNAVESHLPALMADIRKLLDA